MSRRAQLAAAAAAAVLVASTLYSVSVLTGPGRLAAESQRWPGHYTLLARVQDTPAGDDRGALRAAATLLASRWSVVSRFTSFESVNAFARFERVRVADLPARLDEADPRFDPHLRALPGLFSTVALRMSASGVGAQEALSATPPRSRFEVMYVRSNQSPLGLLLSARFLLRGSGVRIDVAELALGHTLLSLLLLSVGVVVARLVLETYRLLLWLAALPYLAVVMASDVGVAALGAALYVFAFWLAPILAAVLLEPKLVVDSRLRWRSGLSTGALFVAVALLGVVAATLVLAWSIQLALVLLASATTTLRGRRGYLRIVTPQSRATIRASLSFGYRPGAGRALRLRAAGARFWQRAIGYARRLSPGWLRFLVAVVLAATVTVALPLVAARPDGDPTLVASPPERTTRAPVSRLSELTELATDASLPSMATLVSHEAYQAALPYGAVYRLPAAGESLTLPRYTLTPAGEVESWAQELRTFDDRWLQDLVADPERGSVLSLLALVGDAQPVLAPTRSGVRAESGARVLGVAAALLLVIAATLTRLSGCATTPARSRRTVGGKPDRALRPHQPV